MKILQVNSVYNKGSTGKITFDIHTELKRKGIDSVVCYGRGEKVVEENVYKTCSEVLSKANNVLSRLSGIMYGGNIIATKKLISIIKKEKPDIVHLQCINGYFVNIYKVVEFLKTNNIKTVLTLHAEFIHTANCGYALDCENWRTGCGNCPRLKKETKSVLFDRTSTSFDRMKKAFDGFDENLVVTSVSPWLMNRAKISPILKGKHHCVVYNGLDTDVFNTESSINIRDKHSLGNSKVVFHATPSFSTDINHIKGGYYVIEMAKRLPDVKFIVAGNYDAAITYPANIIFLGNISDKKTLAAYYAQSDITLLTSQKETFSMICAESLCCGTPIVGFKAGAPEQISLKEYSEFVEYANQNFLERVILKWLYEKNVKKNEISSYAKGIYSKEKMAEIFLDIYKKQ